MCRAKTRPRTIEIEKLADKKLDPTEVNKDCNAEQFLLIFLLKLFVLIEKD